jgi:hypothetical protein
MVFFNPFMLGEKKYSPPFGMMKTPIEREFNGLRGSSPIMLLVPWPMSGSRLSRRQLLWIKKIDKQNFITYPGRFTLVKGGFGLVKGGKLLLSAHAKSL